MSVAKHPILVVIILYVITVEEDIYVLARLVTLEKLTSVLIMTSAAIKSTSVKGILPV